MVSLVEVTTVDQLVERLRKGKFRSIDEVKADRENNQYPSVVYLTFFSVQRRHGR